MSDSDNLLQTEIVPASAETSEKSPSSETGAPPSHGPEDPAVTLLQTLHAASLSRWANRRDHEWKLNYAFWTPIVGLIALVVTKHIHFAYSSQVLAWLLLAITAVLLIQLVYLLPITDRAICEIEMQTDIEKAMRSKLDPATRAIIRLEFLGAGMDRRSKRDKRYGTYSPLAVTALLLLLAVFFLLYPTR